ncbi:hypothetical protein JNJ66_04430 [Candidatus Saccharibacteria bacterium]|nr:hypothetical protein [Candidatus Saccharibacteria bacterium]
MTDQRPVPVEVFAQAHLTARTQKTPSRLRTGGGWLNVHRADAASRRQALSALEYGDVRLALISLAVLTHGVLSAAHNAVLTGIVAAAFGPDDELDEALHSAQPLGQDTSARDESLIRLLDTVRKVRSSRNANERRRIIAAALEAIL